MQISMNDGTKPSFEIPEHDSKLLMEILIKKPDVFIMARDAGGLVTMLNPRYITQIKFAAYEE
jgi:hypothetical protein